LLLRFVWPAAEGSEKENRKTIAISAISDRGVVFIFGFIGFLLFLLK
jgi:hypothetical protein